MPPLMVAKCAPGLHSLSLKASRFKSIGVNRNGQLSMMASFARFLDPFTANRFSIVLALLQ